MKPPDLPAESADADPTELGTASARSASGVETATDEAEKDPVRGRVRRLLWERGLTMRQASMAMGRHGSYLHQFMVRGSPKVLGFRDAEKLAALLGCAPSGLHPPELPKKRKTPVGKGPRGKATAGQPETAGHGLRERGHPPEPVVRVPEVAVEASAGPGAFTDEHVTERAHWFLPEGMVRHEGNAAPGDLRLLRVRGESMEPELSDGDRLVVDTARARPLSGEMCVLWDGAGLVVKRIEHVPGADGPPLVRLKSANPAYADYDCLAQDVHLVGRVVWSIRKV